MGLSLTLTASDGHKLGAYGADPSGQPKGGIVVIQEIFGVNHHIRSVVDRLAAEGYAALAPALFDRTQPNFQSGYTPDEVANARKFVANPDWDAMLRDTQAAIEELDDVGPLAIMGFCMGGTVSFLAACRLSGLSAAVCYYGGGIGRFADEKPKCPTQMHFGRKDAHIPMDVVEFDQGQAARGGGLRLRRGRPRLPLRRAWQLSRRERTARLGALDGIPRQDHEVIGEHAADHHQRGAG